MKQQSIIGAVILSVVVGGAAIAITHNYDEKVKAEAVMHRQQADKAAEAAAMKKSEEAAAMKKSDEAAAMKKAEADAAATQ